jgi:hypothetical protein
MSKQLPSKGVAAILSAIPITGIFGSDKYYVGQTNQGIAQTVLSVSIIGLLASIPWNLLSTLSLVLLILTDQRVIYPDIEWAPTTQFDKNVAYIISALYILSVIVNIFRYNPNMYTRKNVSVKRKSSKRR